MSGIQICAGFAGSWLTARVCTPNRATEAASEIASHLAKSGQYEAELGEGSFMDASAVRFCLDVESRLARLVRRIPD
jgi:hypothetical protein